MPKEITQAMVGEYIDNGGSRCPFCGGDRVEGDYYSFGYEGATVWQKVECEDCGEEWQDIYTLTTIERKP